MTSTPIKPSYDWNMVTLKWAGTYTDGSPAAGTLTVGYNSVLPLLDDDATLPLSIFPVAITVPIGTRTVLIDGVSRTVGYAEVSVPASNDPDIAGSGATYSFSENLSIGTGRKSVNFVADKDAPGGVVWINKVAGATSTPAQPVQVVYWSDFNALSSRVTTLEQGGVGGSVQAATTTTAGIVELADNTEALAGTALDRAITPAALTARLNALLNGAPAGLDQLNELAAAIGNDANYAATITAALAGKQAADADLTAIAALTTTAYGRALLTLANQAALTALIAAASTTVAGIVELADLTETATGTAVDRAVTPAGLKSISDTLARRVQAWQPSTAYVAGELVTNGGILYSRTTSGTSGTTFSASNWTAITSGTTLPSGTYDPVVFPYTDPAVLRPTTAASQIVFWSGPPDGSGGAPANMGSNDFWFMKLS